MGGNERYVALLRDEYGDWGLVDVEGSIYIRSVCEIPLEGWQPPAVTTNTPGNNNLQCDDGWIKRGRSCYHFDDNMLKRPQTASRCRNWDSFLVAINDEEEYQFIQQQILRLIDEGEFSAFWSGFWTAGARHDQYAQDWYLETIDGSMGGYCHT